MAYLLKQYDNNIAKFDMFHDNSGFNVKNLELLNKDFLPLNMIFTEEGVISWLKQRSIPKNRAYVDRVLSKMGLSHNNTKGIIDLCYGLSLNDCYWVIDENKEVTFKEVNLYENRFSNVLAYIAFTGFGSSVKSQFMSSPEFTTNGMLPKCWRRMNGKIMLYKGGTTGFANAGLEPYSEYYASQIAKSMGLDAIEYNLSKWKGTLSSTCELFTDINYSYIPIGYLIPKGGVEAVTKYLKELGEEFYQAFIDMLVFDSIICNSDRHYGNFGVIVNNKTNKIEKFAPIFDNGAGLFVYAMDNDEFTSIDTLLEYAKTRTSQMHMDFVSSIKPLITERQKEKIRKLINFKFKKHSKYNLSNKRIKLLEKFIQIRIQELLK